MTELLVESWKLILLNLTEVPTIDSSGIGELVASIKVAKRFELTVKLLLPGGRVRNVLEVSHILPYLEVYEVEEEALASFAH